MFREGIHRARFKHRRCAVWLYGMTEYNRGSPIYLYTNAPAFNGSESYNFKKNSYGYKYCYAADTSYLEDIIYTDHNYIGEL